MQVEHLDIKVGAKVSDAVKDLTAVAGSLMEVGVAQETVDEETKLGFDIEGLDDLERVTELIEDLDADKLDRIGNIGGVDVSPSADRELATSGGQRRGGGVAPPRLMRQMMDRLFHTFDEEIFSKRERFEEGKGKKLDIPELRRFIKSLDGTQEMRDFYGIQRPSIDEAMDQGDPVLSSLPTNMERFMGQRGDPIEIDADLRELSSIHAQIDTDSAREFWGIGEQTIDEAMGQGDPVMSGADERRRKNRTIFDWLRRSFEEDGEGIFAAFKDFSKNLRATDINNAVAKLVPLLLVFVGALPAAITGMYALAGAALVAASALAGLTAFAALGFAVENGQFKMQRLKEAFNRIKDSFLEAFAPLLDKLSGWFKKGLDGLERFFAGLAAQGDVLLALRDNAEAVGGFLIQTLPPLIARAGEFADMMLDVFGLISARFEGFDIFSALADILSETLDPLVRFGKVLMDVFPAIVQLSVGFLNLSRFLIMGISILGTIIGAFLTLGGIVPLDVISFLVGLMLTAITVEALWTAMNWALVDSFVGGIIGSLWNTITALYGYISATLASAGATGIFASALAALLTLTGVGAVLAVLAGGFNLLAGNVSDATKQLKKFQRTAGVTSSMSPSFGGGGGGGTRYVDVTQNVTVEGGSDPAEQNRTARKAAYQMRNADQYFSR